jgi:hypothetical protein
MRENLNGNWPGQRDIRRAIDRTHATGPQGRIDSVVRKHPTDEWVWPRTHRRRKSLFDGRWRRAIWFVWVHESTSILVCKQ